MSAFIVSAGTMQRAVRGIVAVKDDLRWGCPLLTAMSNDPTAIGDALYAMNQSAIIQRYPNDKNGDYSETPRFSYSFAKACCSLPAAVKALQCLRYQCSEGAVPQSPLYLELSRAIEYLALKIIRGMPDYEKAPWDAAA